jgi:hypothetical protein
MTQDSSAPSRSAPDDVTYRTDAFAIRNALRPACTAFRGLSPTWTPSASASTPSVVLDRPPL